jgi:YggT family protein
VIGLGARSLLGVLVLLLMVLVLARVVVSWVDPRGRSEMSRLVITLSEPILGPVRRALPSTGGLDFSPMLVLIVLGVLVRALGV